MKYVFDKQGKSCPTSTIFDNVRDKLTHEQYQKLFAILGR